MTEELKHIAIIPILKISLNKKIKGYLTNKAIISSVIIIITILSIIYKIYLDYGDLNPIVTLVATSLLTLLLVVIWESYNSENRKNELLYAFNDELIENLIILLDNNNNLIEELSLFKQGNNWFYRLKEVKFNMYQILRQTFPEELHNMGYLDINRYIAISQEFNNAVNDKAYREKLILIVK